MRAIEFIVEQSRADLYKGATFDNAESILATNQIRGSRMIGNKPLPKDDPSRGPEDSWAWNRRGSEKYHQLIKNPDDIELSNLLNDPFNLSPEEEQRLDYLMAKKDQRRTQIQQSPNYKKTGHISGVVSLTRDKNITHNFLDAYGNGVIFVLDQDLLRQDYGRRIHPYSDIHGGGPLQRNRGSESEESVYGGIQNVKKYIKRIEFVGDFDPTAYPHLAKYYKHSKVPA
jgi:hypothetical protein